MKSSLVFSALLLCFFGANAALIDFVGCSKDTCSNMSPSPNLNVKGTVTAITGIADSYHCPGKCTVVESQSGQMHVIGNYLDIKCRAWGGNFCGYKWRGTEK